MNGIKAFDLKDADEAILKKIFLLNESYAPFLGPLEGAACSASQGAPRQRPAETFE